MRLTKEEKETILLMINLTLQDKDIYKFNINKYFKLREKIVNDLHKN